MFGQMIWNCLDRFPNRARAARRRISAVTSRFSGGQEGSCGVAQRTQSGRSFRPFNSQEGRHGGAAGNPHAAGAQSPASPDATSGGAARRWAAEKRYSWGPPQLLLGQKFFEREKVVRLIFRDSGKKIGVESVVSG